MKPLNLITKCLLLAFSYTALSMATTHANANTWNNATGKATLKAFNSEEDLTKWLEKKKAEYEKHVQAQQNKRSVVTASEKSVGDSGAVAAMPSAPLPAVTMEMSASQDESVTNTQTAGVDEGGIVKVHGDHLVVLRRGRIFTIDISGKSLKPVSTVDAFAPGTSGNAWYDEMLISDNTVVVIGYSYGKGGTEVILFDISKNGQLSYKSTYVLRSNDYYSSRNSASRLVGNKLIFYTPMYLNLYGNARDNFPAMYEWKQGTQQDFKPIAPATQIYRVNDDIDPTGGIALHTVQVCDLSVQPMNCKASGILGPSGREFYVSQDAVYIWTVPYNNYRAEKDAPVNSAVFRLPLDNKAAPTALKTLGGPIDQFSFLESEGHLNVLLRAEGPSASMWSSEIGSNNLALLRVPLSEFGDGTTAAPIKNYHALPQPTGGYSLQNRYIGDFLVYGSGTTWGSYSTDQQQVAAYIMNYKQPQVKPAALPIDHSVDRIEALGSYPLVVGTKEGDLYFSSLSPKVLTSADSIIRVVRVGEYKLEGAAQGETRSHGFFYKPSDAENGILGLPFQNNGRGGWSQLKDVSNGIIYLQNNKLKLSDVGILAANPAPNTNDNCKASCTDWYGNSRPLFVKGRVFALMGYELVEGKITNQKIVEVQRLDFTPKVETQQRIAK